MLQIDDRLALDAKLAIHLLGWGWWYDPQWEWVGLFPPASPDWERLNFPDGARPIESADGRTLSPTWMVGGCPANEKNRVGVPHFAGSWEGMSTVIHQMAQRGFWWRGVHHATPGNSTAHAIFASNTAVWEAQAETLPRAAAMAAVNALEGTKTAVWGELSADSVRGKLTSIRLVACGAGGEDASYVRWLEAKNTMNTSLAALEFIAETADAALVL